MIRIISKNRLFIQESLVEIILRGTMSGMLLLSVYLLERKEIGTYNLAASIAVFLGGAYGGGWIYRISLKGLRKIRPNAAFMQVLSIYFFIFTITNLLLFLLDKSHNFNFLVALNALELNSFLVTLQEIIWAINSQNSNLMRLSTRKLIVLTLTCMSFFSYFIVNPSFYVIVFLQPSVNILVVISNLQFSRNMNVKKIVKENSKTLFGTKHDLKNSFFLSGTGMLSMLTFVIDNFLIAKKFGVSRLPEYSVGFATTGIAIGLVGTPLQRILSVKQLNIHSRPFMVKVVTVTILSCCTTSALLIILNSFQNNLIIKEALLISVCLFPYAVSKVISMVINIRLGQYGKMRKLISSYLIYITIFALIMNNFTRHTDIFYVALLVSFSSVLSTLFLYVQSRNTSTDAIN